MLTTSSARSRGSAPALYLLLPEAPALSKDSLRFAAVAAAVLGRLLIVGWLGLCKACVSNFVTYQ